MFNHLVNNKVLLYIRYQSENSEIKLERVYIWMKYIVDKGATYFR